MEPIHRPLQLGDIFDRTFTLIGKTFFRNLSVGICVLVPATILLTIGLSQYFKAVGTFVTSQTAVSSHRESTFNGGRDSTAEQPVNEDEYESPGHSTEQLHGKGSTQADLDTMKSLGGSMAIAALLYIVYILLVITGEALCAFTVCKEIEGTPLSWSGIFSSTGWRIARRSVGQSIIQFFIFSVGIALVVLAVSLFLAFLGKPGILLTVLLVLGALTLLVFLALRWMFASVAIAAEQVSVIESLRRSYVSVRGYWWRTFGLIILFSLITMFASSLVSTPVGFFMMWDFYSGYFHSLGSHGSSAPDPAVIQKLLGSFGWGFGLVAGLSALLQMLIAPVYKCTMYYDLRARQREYAESQAPPPIAPSRGFIPTGPR